MSHFNAFLILFIAAAVRAYKIYIRESERPRNIKQMRRVGAHFGSQPGNESDPGAERDYKRRTRAAHRDENDKRLRASSVIGVALVRALSLAGLKFLIDFVVWPTASATPQ